MTSITHAPVHYPPAHANGYANGYGDGYAGENGVETVYVPSAPSDHLMNGTHIRRSPWLPLPFLLPTFLCGVSWLGGGVQILTDLGFTLLALMCFVCCIRELMVFRHRFGIGGLLVFGGTLIWWCHDYFVRWFGNAHGTVGLSGAPPVVAKAAFITSLFVLMMSVGMLLPWGKRAEKIIVSMPEPTSNSFYFYLVLILFVIGISPYFIFTNEPFYSVIWKEMTAMRSHRYVTWWTVGRGGTLATSWGAYVVHIIQIGWLGGLLAAFYAVMIGRNIVLNLLCWAIWLFWVLLALGSGTRGYVVYFVLPVVVLIFIKSEIRARRRGGFNAVGYLVMPFVALATLALVQFQGTFRNIREYNRSFSQVDLFKSQGNHMFTEPLLAYELVPRIIPHTRDTFPGASVVRPIPDEVIRFATGWIPRMVWTSKPGFDDFALMYNKMMSGGNAQNAAGATICLNVAGGAYVWYGLPGVIEMGILYGWLCVLVERGFRRANFRPAATLFILGLFQYLFRCFRDLTPHDLYPLLIGAGAMAILVIISRPLFGTDAPEPAQGQGYDPSTSGEGAYPAEAYA